MTKRDLAAFASGIGGKVLLPGTTSYESARMVWNGMIDKRPAVIIRCATPADVISSVRFARERHLEIAVRGGGHNVAGTAVCDDGMVIDLSPMKGIRVDPERSEAYAQAGLTWGEFDRETQAHGLAVPGGLISTTGIAGLTLGGGIGWLSRKYGLSCDNLLSVDLVTAEGEFITADPSGDSDLFWGIRGGGGNFGIVTSFRYRLHSVRELTAGPVLHPFENAAAVLRLYGEFTRDCPDELTSIATLMTAPPAPFLPPAIHGRKVVGTASAHCGRMADAESAIRPLREHGHPAADLVGPIAYLNLQSSSDPISPPGLRHYWKSEFLPDLSPTVIDALIAEFASVPSSLTAIFIHHLGGAIARVGEEETAYSHRKAEFIVNIDSTWEDPGEDDRNMQWARKLWEVLHRSSGGGTYVNFLGAGEGGRVREVYGAAKYGRLSALKARVDPENLFHLNQNIRPA